ncbi:MAG: DUF3795 domain-containing protein [Anaerofustis sp.]
MIKERGIAYCGLACCICSQNEICVGCRKDGCEGKDWCKNFVCCKTKGIAGCWECEEFPCGESMLDKPKIRAFSEFVRRYGEEKLMECLAENERNGLIYHHPGTITGDYDESSETETIIHMILTGQKKSGSS